MASVEAHSSSLPPKPIALDERLAFLGMNDEAKARLRQLRPLLKRALDGALNAFYAKVRATPQISGFFSNDRHMEAAKSAQAAHWDVLAQADFSDSYAQAVRRIGKAHASRGLEPRWYIGGYAIVLEQIIHAVVRERWPKILAGGKNASEDMAATLSAVVKASLLDMDLSISIYLDALDEQFAVARAERERVQKDQEEAAQAMAAALSRLAQGDLESRFTASVAAQFEPLKSDFNVTTGKLAEAFKAIAESTNIIESATNEISTAAEDLSRRTGAQAASLEQTSAALAEVTGAINETANNTRHANEIVSTTKEQAEKGGAVVIKAIEAMARIEKSSKDIGQIIGVIDEIAFQTNLLALNAGVEAARAGEAGRGFAVVASEVRALAQRSADAAKEIKALITTSEGAVEQGSGLVAETGAALKAIVTHVAEVANVVATIAANAKDQASALSQVGAAVNQMDQATQHNAAMVEETTAATQSMHQETRELGQAVARFNIGHASRPPQNAKASNAKASHVRTPQPALKRIASGGGAAVAKPRADEEGWEEF
jgi:methyl-accepting chemotaxis protein